MSLMDFFNSTYYQKCAVSFADTVTTTYVVVSSSQVYYITM